MGERAERGDAGASHGRRSAGVATSAARRAYVAGRPAVVAEALDGVPPPSCLLAWSCALNGDLCGDRIGEQVGLVQELAGDVPTFGFHTYGEFARTVGGSGFHNATMSVALVL